ncbi:hypothetical protein [Pantoea sp. AS142]|uniref:hypothetical protein n=1 Tax=Pantoea sp. AS142 TaxID=3081292 RepID=UPI003016E1B9
MALWGSATLTALQSGASKQGTKMAIFFGRVNKSEWEHTGLFANIVPVYLRNMESGEPDVCAANGVPEWFFELITLLACCMPLPYEGFMFTHVKPIESTEKAKTL